MKNALPIFLVAVIIGLFYQYITPQYKHVRELQLERDGYNEIILKAAELRQVRSELETKVGQFSEEELESLEKMLPNDIDLVHLVLEVNSIALKNGIIMNNIVAEEKKVDVSGNGSDQEMVRKDYNTLALSFEFETSYKNLKTFLPELERSLRVMDIVSLDIVSNEEQRTIQNYNMTIETYYIGNQ